MDAGAAVTDPRLVIDVDNLAADGWAFHGSIPAERVTHLLATGGAESELSAAGPLELDLHASPMLEGLRVEGSAVAAFERPCDRCATPTPLTVTLAVAQTLFPAKAAPAAPAPETDAPARSRRRGKKERKPAAEEVVDFSQSWDVEDVDVSTFENGKVNVEELVWEHVLLEVPFTHLCRESCKGLCQTCGADLNAGPCGCRPEPKNTKLAALANFKIQ